MRITALKCAVIGKNPIVRVVTDEGVSGFAAVESFKPYLRSHLLYYEQFIVGEDPTDVERVMLKLRHRGAFKPWGSGVSAIEMALWDLAGKAAGVLAADRACARNYLRAGAQFVAVGSDVSLLVKAARELIRAFKPEAGPSPAPTTSAY